MTLNKITKKNVLGGQRSKEVTADDLNIVIDAINDLGDGSISGALTLSDTTQSTTKDTGALIVEGGVGIEKNVNIGGNSVVTGTETVNSTTDTTSGSTGAIVTPGGIGVAKAIFAGTNITAGTSVITDTISEKTTSSGTTNNSVLMKSGTVKTGAGSVSSAALKVNADNTGLYSVSGTQLGITIGGSLKGGFDSSGIFTGTISEQVGGVGVTVGSVLLKSGGVVLTHGTATEAANAVTINQPSGVITTSTLTTAAASSYDITLTNSFISSTSVITLSNGTYSGTLGTNGIPVIYRQDPGSGTMVIRVYNSATVNALNGTLKIHFIIS